MDQPVIERQREALDDYAIAAVDGASRLAHIARVSYEAGERSILELIDAYRTDARARLRTMDLARVVRREEIELEYLTGWEGRR